MQVHYLKTPGGVVKARSVGVCTGGYTSAKVCIQSLRIAYYQYFLTWMVTRPLTQDEIAACNFKTNQVITDTRILRHYYRRWLPDNRESFDRHNACSAISGKNAPEKKYEDMLSWI